MIDESGRLKLLDFGIGTLTGLSPEAAAEGLTADGLTVGTVEYMSPEQAAGRPVDGRSDLYSLGCVLYHLLTRPPPVPDREQDRLDGDADEQPARPGRFRSAPPSLGRSPRSSIALMAPAPTVTRTPPRSSPRSAASSAPPAPPPEAGRR